MSPLRTLSSLVIAACLAVGCGASQKEKKDADFHSSGSPEADQRAEETVAKRQQLRNEGMEQTDTHRTLYSRLGGQDGLVSIVNDWVERAMADPRVNWRRLNVKSGGFLGLRKKDMSWNPTPEKVAEMKKHIVQFLSLSTGGPAHYDGRDMKSSHAGMNITNAEFEAAKGDLIATLEAHKVQTQEIKELLEVIETTRPMMVEER